MGPGHQGVRRGAQGELGGAVQVQAGWLPAACCQVHKGRVQQEGGPYGGQGGQGGRLCTAGFLHMLQRAGHVLYCVCFSMHGVRVDLGAAWAGADAGLLLACC